MESRLILESPKPFDDLVETAARLETVAGTHRMWWRVPAQWQHALTPWADPFVVAFLFPMMQQGADVRVAGRVSPSLLENLERHMALWHAWRPNLYRPVNISADDEIESPPPATRGQAAVTFSGGVDSCFTAWRHTRARDTVGRRARTIGAGVFINGMDIHLDDPRGASRYAAALSVARDVLESIDVRCLPVSSNFREIPSNSNHSHATLLVASLRLFAGTFDTGIIPNTVNHAQLSTVWGSHPLVDPFLGSQNFRVLDDGVEHSRTQKLQLIAAWPQAMQHLRVCIPGVDGGIGNCCRCSKCIRTLIACRIAGIPRPPAFSRDITNDQIHRVKFHREIKLRYWQELIDEAAARNLSHAPWVKAMRVPLRRHKRRQWWKRLILRKAIVR